MSGVTDHGSVTVYAKQNKVNEWVLECTLPGWHSRDEECRQNVKTWMSMNAITLHDSGTAILTVANKLTLEDTDHNLARMASLLGATILAATFVRRRMGMARGQLEAAA